MDSSVKQAMRRLVVLIAGTLLFLAACGDDDSVVAEPDPTATAEPTATTEPTAAPEPTATTAPEPPTPTAVPEPTATPVPEGQTVNVYWLRDTGIAVGGRMVPSPALPAEAMEQLLAGPNDLEVDLGMVSAIPAGTQVLGLALDHGTATIDLSAEFEATGLGTSGEIGLVSQVVFTLTQFTTVETVNITIEGEDRDAILSHGLEAKGLTREGFFDAVAPAIVVESPYPGQLVSSPLTVSGFSRTFEASVVYAVTIPPSDEITAEGSATAAQPDVHLFGPFEFTVEFEPDVAGFGSVIVFEESARDGSQINIYEVPVTMEAGSAPTAEAALEADALERLLTVDNSFGPDVFPFERVHIASVVGGDVGRPLEAGAFGRVSAALGDRSPVLAVEDAEALIAELFEDADAREAVAIVEDLRVDGTRAEIEMRLWCGSLCGVFLTYEAEFVDDEWQILGTTGPIAVS